jgi:hypothetical protein
MTTQSLLFATAIAFVALAPAQAANGSAQANADQVPQQFVGSWCASQSPTTFEGVIYNRSNTCKSAHVPEDHIILKSDRLSITDVIECKFLEIVSITRHGTHRLKFWCKSNYDTWLYEIWISALGQNKLAVQDVKKD